MNVFFYEPKNKKKLHHMNAYRRSFIAAKGLGCLFKYPKVSGLRSFGSKTEYATEELKREGKAQEQQKVSNPLHGSYHWYFERVVATGTMVLLTGMVVLPETYAWIDLGLNAFLPIHCHLGMDCIITDYLPQRKFPVAYLVSRSFLITGTLLTAYGMYQFNTNNIGVSAAVKKLWSRKKLEPAS